MTSSTLIRLHFTPRAGGWTVSGQVPQGAVRAVRRSIKLATRLVGGQVAGRGRGLTHRQAVQMVADLVRGVEVELAPLGYDVWLTAAPGR